MSALEGIIIDYAEPERDAKDYIPYFNKVAGETRFCSFDGGCYKR